MMKVHLYSVYNSPRTRCGVSTMNPNVLLVEEFSSKVTCKMCQRLHAQDMAKDGDDS